MENIAEITNLLTQRANAFEEFKATNNARLEALEKNNAHAELDEKLTKISNSMTSLEDEIAKLKTPSFKADTKENYANFFKNAFDGKFENAVVVGTNGNGGYAVPDGLDRIVTDYIMQDCVMAQLVKNAPFIAGYKKNVTITNGAAEFGVESTVASKQNTPTIAQVAAVQGKLLTKQEISEEARLEMTMDPEGWVRDNIGMLFTEKLESQILSGTGSDGQTKGILGYINSAVGAADFGKIEFFKTGAAGDFDSTAPLDKVKEMIYGLKTAYLRNAKFVMSRSAALKVAQLKDADGHYMWEPSVIADRHDKLFNYDVLISDSMPAVSSGSNSIIFGDFKKGVRLGMDSSTYIVRDNITDFPKVNLMFSRIYDLTLLDSRALKIMQFAS